MKFTQDRTFDHSEGNGVQNEVEKRVFCWLSCSNKIIYWNSNLLSSPPSRWRPSKIGLGQVERDFSVPGKTNSAGMLARAQHILAQSVKRNETIKN